MSLAVGSKTFTHTTGAPDGGGVLVAETTSPRFAGLVLDDSPELLEASYRLRYQVYCMERRFLPAERYPDGLEIDAFDRHSVHLGVLSAQGQLVATARLVQPSEAGLPVLHHCRLFAGLPSLADPAKRVAELSRLCVSRRHNQSARGEGREIVQALYKTLYQASKRRGFTHWLAATERSLQRLLAPYACPFRAVGPETDYSGSVTPYLASLAEWDRVIVSRRIALLDDFIDGLERQFRPIDAPPIYASP